MRWLLLVCVLLGSCLCTVRGQDGGGTLVDQILDEPGRLLTVDYVHTNDGGGQLDELVRTMPILNGQVHRVGRKINCEEEFRDGLQCQFGGEGTFRDTYGELTPSLKPLDEEVAPVAGVYSMTKNTNMAIKLPIGISSDFWKSPIERKNVDHVTAYSATGIRATFTRQGDAVACTMVPFWNATGAMGRNAFRDMWNADMKPICTYWNIPEVARNDLSIFNANDQANLTRQAMEMVMNFLHNRAAVSGVYVASNDFTNADDVSAHSLSVIKVVNVTDMLIPGWSSVGARYWFLEKDPNQEWVDEMLDGHEMVVNAVGKGSAEQALVSSLGTADIIQETLEDLNTLTLVLATASAVVGIGFEYLLDSMPTASFGHKLFKAAIIIGEGVATLLPAAFLFSQYGVTSRVSIVGMDVDRVAARDAVYNGERFRLEMKIGYATAAQVQLLSVGLPLWFVVINFCTMALWVVVIIYKIVRLILERRRFNQTSTDEAILAKNGLHLEEKRGSYFDEDEDGVLASCRKLEQQDPSPFPRPPPSAPR